MYLNISIFPLIDLFTEPHILPQTLHNKRHGLSSLGVDQHFGKINEACDVHKYLHIYGSKIEQLLLKIPFNIISVYFVAIEET